MPKNLNKEELIETLMNELFLSKTLATSVLNLLGEKIFETITAYDQVALTGFGSPVTIKRKQKTDAKLSPLEEMMASGQKLSKVLEESKPGFEQRKLQRRNFILDFAVQNQKTGEIIGDLGDITTEGLMLVSEEEIEADKTFQLRISMPEEAEEELDIVFKARSIRCQETIHESIFTTGFSLVDLDEETREKIEYLIREFAV